MVEILWSPAGHNLPSLGSKALVDVSDGDTPNVRMPIRMLSVDTPEVTARSDAGAERVDAEFAQLAVWIQNGDAPVSDAFAAYILPKLAGGGTLQLAQGKAASAFFKDQVAVRLARPGKPDRSLFIRTADAPFDNYGRLLAYVAPNYTKQEREQLPREQRTTFNLDLVASGWAAPFILYPSIPGELDLPLVINAAQAARDNGLGQHADPGSLPGYEYRMCEKLHDITKKLVVDGDNLSIGARLKWRSRYCADMTTRELRGPEGYMSIPEPHRLWIWPNDVRNAIGSLNLIPTGVGAATD
ncbi:MAG: thermonuclease family protein [Actinomycetota bacterium]